MRHAFDEPRILLHEDLSGHDARESAICVRKVEEHRHHHLNAAGCLERLILTNAPEEFEKTRFAELNQRIEHRSL